MPNETTHIAAIKEIIHATNLDETRVNGAILIGKLSGGTLHYLHKLFVPGVRIYPEIERILKFPVPQSYAEFFSFSDGATLFDNTLFLYGVVGSSTRSVAVEHVRPVSLAEQVQIQRKINPNLEWVEVGSLAAATKNFSLQINQHGFAALVSPEGHSLQYPTFLLMISVLVQMVHANCGANGLLDESGETLQTEIENYLRTAKQ